MTLRPHGGRLAEVHAGGRQEAERAVVVFVVVPGKEDLPERAAIRDRSEALGKASFAFETTLSSRSFAPWLSELQRDGYAVHMVFLWLSSPELAVQRVADRVAMGGHSVPEETVRRRYRTGLRNFLTLYQDRPTTWSLFDSSRPQLRLIAEHLANGTLNVYHKETSERIAQHSDEN